MSHVPHELPEEFPKQLGRMMRLKEEDSHFGRLYDEYHRINRAIHRAETDVEPTDDLHMNDMRKERMRLKDEIARILS